MEFLSWMFFCLSPFALFCSENGSGLILCPVFIALGFVFKRSGDNSRGRTVVKIEPQKFWEWHYKDRMRSALAQKDSINDGLMALKDKEARSWATTICGYHNAWVPPESEQERIARANGVITEQMIKEKTIKKDRIQIGKYFLMCELKFKYEKKWIMRNQIEKDMLKIKISHSYGADDWWVKQRYGMTVGETWETLSPEEKQQAEKWIIEYEEKLVKTVQYYEDYKEYAIRPVEMDF